MCVPEFFVFLIILTMASFHLSPCSGKEAIICPKAEKQALLSFIHSAKNPTNIEKFSSWNQAHVDCCTWEGVICSNFTGHVLELHLQDSYLSGKLGNSLINLRHLKHLNLSYNDFEGTIPASMGSFAELEYLDLSNAGFHGTVPPTLGNLSSLRSFVLGQYELPLALDVDNLEWLSGLSHLDHLHIEHVNLSKVMNWLQVINTLPSLVELTFIDCSLYTIAPLNEVNFSSLAFLDLSYNDFRSIPRWIFQLRKLRYLDLSFNSIEGSIPSVVGNLTSLNFLALSQNEFSGVIPNGIAKLCKMRTMDLSHNKLSGDTSIVLGNGSNCFLESLENLNLRDNQLSGNLTNELGEFKSLQSLDLGDNSLNGSIPSNIGKLFLLEYLTLDTNKFTGNLPETIGQLGSLKQFNLDNNMLQGVVSEIHFANLTGLNMFIASRNRLTMNVSANWIPSFKLQNLELGSWNLGAGGQIPSWLHTQKNYISHLDLSDTGIACQVPSWFWNTIFLNLSHNQLHGNIPDIINGPLFIYLSYNLFTGSIPRVRADELDLSNNLFTGGLNHFLCDATDVTYLLRVLHVGENLLSGELPDCWMKWSALTVLNLGNNNISGRIPNSIGFLENLLFLDLFNNTLSGQIPSSMQNCTKLTIIDLSHNQLIGRLPEWFGVSLESLRILILRSNKLSGKISSNICRLRSLQILDLSHNRIFGEIPSCVDNFTAMAVGTSWVLDNERGELWNVVVSYGGHFTDSALVATKGSNLQYDTVLSLVINIDLSRNNLSGSIPEQLTRLVELRSLNLQGNRLRGLIPNGIGNMKQLESLDLSRNSLSGEIPNSLAVLTSLNYLNLSYNNLTGRIPQSTQIMGLPESGFIGNKLCGLPLPSNCDNDGENETPGLTHEEDDDGVGKSEVEWLYVFISFGYVAGLSTVCNILIFKKPWRDAFFELVDNLWNKVYVYARKKRNIHG